MLFFVRYGSSLTPLKKNLNNIVNIISNNAEKIKMINYNYEIKSQNYESSNSNYETNSEIRN